MLPLYMGVTRRYQESWLTDKLDAFVAVHELSLGQALVEIQDAGHTLPAGVVAKLVSDEDLKPRPTKAEMALITSMTDKVGYSHAVKRDNTVHQLHHITAMHQRLWCCLRQGTSDSCGGGSGDTQWGTPSRTAVDGDGPDGDNEPGVDAGDRTDGE